MRRTDDPWWVTDDSDRRSGSVYSAFMVLQAAERRENMNEDAVVRRAVDVLRRRA